METRVQKTAELHQKGCNCAQAVLVAYADLFGLSEKEAYKIAEGFGTGMGGMGETCGAVTAAFMLIGLKNSSGVTGDKTTRPDTYKQIRELADAFKAEAGSITCRELKGSTGLPVYPCPKCIETAARLFEKSLNSNG
ncbi:MAG: C_GCAxxG_C_C family protein [Alphaproteobacteria bacterium]|nr:C_GCAxxG_C_C family protein [Alphaproteobacteria bacterium]MBO4643352.1 C_GCAxxG_C_C family protein [Alphaproteobacteria bacterium]